LAVILLGLPVVSFADISMPYYQIYTLYTWNAPGGDLTQLTLSRRFFIQIIMSSNKDEYALMIFPSVYTEESAKEAGDENLVGQFDITAPPQFLPLYVFRDEEEYGRLRFILYNEYEDAETGDIGIGIDFMLNCHIVKNKYLVPDKDNPYIYISPEDFANGVKHNPLSENIYPQKFAVKTLLEGQNAKENTTKSGLYQFYGYTYDENGTPIGYTPSYVYDSTEEETIAEQLYLESGNVYNGARRKEGYSDRFEPVGDSFGNYAFIKATDLSFSKDFLKVSLVGTTADVRYLYFQSSLFNTPKEIKSSMLSSTFFFNDAAKVYYDKNLTMIEAIAEKLKAEN
jgi:hypothetical protein